MHGKIPPSRVGRQDASDSHSASSIERATMEAIYNSLHVNHLWITKFVKLPKDTVGSFIMTFHDAVATKTRNHG